MFYSKSTNGFYAVEVNGDNIPSDSVQISIDTWKELLEGQSSGKIISSDDNGYPILKDPEIIEQPIVVQQDPVEKLKAFLAANPDVTQLLNGE